MIAALYLLRQQENNKIRLLKYKDSVEKKCWYGQYIILISNKST